MFFMMHTSLLAVLAILTSTALTGNIYVDNYCPFWLFLQSSSTPPTINPLVEMPPNTTYAYREVMRDASFSLNALTISATPDLANPLQATYHETTIGPSPGLNYYALSTIYGNPCEAQGFALLAAADGYSITCPGKAPTDPDCPYTYSPSNPKGIDAVFSQNDLEDLVLTLCEI